VDERTSPGWSALLSSCSRLCKQLHQAVSESSALQRHCAQECFAVTGCEPPARTSWRSALLQALERPARPARLVGPLPVDHTAQASPTLTPTLFLSPTLTRPRTRALPLSLVLSLTLPSCSSLPVSDGDGSAAPGRAPGVGVAPRSGGAAPGAPLASPPPSWRTPSRRASLRRMVYTNPRFHHA